MHRELHVRAARRDADGSRGRERGLAEPLVGRVVERLLRRDRPRVAGVDAHRVEVLDRADDDRVAGARRTITSSSCSCQPARYSSTSTCPTGLAARPCATAARSSSGVCAMPPPRAAERERRPHDRRHREVDVGARRDDRARHLEPGGPDGLAEALAVLGAADRLRGRRRSARRRAARARRARLSAVWPPSVGRIASGRSRSITSATVPGVERLEVGRVGPLGVGHDRRRVRVHEHDAVALAPEHAARLRAGVVELARLADADRPGAEDQDRAKVGALRHAAASSSKKGRASSGPGAASGWNWTLAKPSPARPSQVPSFSDTCETSSSAMDGEAVVLDGDEHAAGGEVADGVVGAAVAERELERLVPEREPEQLVAEADPEHAAPARAARGSSRPGRRARPGRRGRSRRARRAAAPRGSRRRPTSAARRTPRPRRRRDGVGIERFEPRSTTTTRGPAPTAYGSSVPTARSSGRPSIGGSASARAWSSSTDRRRRARSGAAVRVADPLHERARVDAGERDHAAARGARPRTPGRASRITTPSHCTRSDSMRASSTP